MKVRLNAIIITLFVVCGLLIGTSSLAIQQSQLEKQRITLSSQGTLLKLTDAYGTNSTKKITGDGFELNYKTQGRTKTAYAIGKTKKGLRNLLKPSKDEGNMATEIVQTADKSLEITSKFTYNADTSELIIKRKIRNISKYSVTLESVRDYVDPAVMVKSGVIKPSRLIPVSMDQITAGISIPDDCGPLEDCPIGPLCTMPPGCPKPLEYHKYYKYFKARLSRSKNRAVLGWSQQITLQPGQKQQPAGEAFIIIRIKIK